jgi:TonB family protein
MNRMPANKVGDEQSAKAAYDREQSRRMLIALFLLLAAIAVVVYRDRQSLFAARASEKPAPSPMLGSVIPTAAAGSDVTPPPATAASLPAGSSPSISKPVTPRKKAAVRPAVATTTKPELPTAAEVTSAAAERSAIPEAPEAYPVLSQHSRVEGSVVLQALISTDGHIADLRVVRGPAVLGSAAREAVMGWKFKPYTHNGSPVETYATITVNFTIRVADGTPKTVAALAPEDVILLADDYRR